MKNFHSRKRSGTFFFFDKLEKGQAHVSSKYTKHYVIEGDFHTCTGVHTS
jgi:hypothetical protein